MSRHSSARHASVLSLRRLRAPVRLGVGQEERATPQDVLIDVRLYLPAPVAAAEDDNADYVCYHTIGKEIHALCAAKEYRLIEYLTHDIHRLLRRLVPAGVGIRIELTKPDIMLPYAEGGAGYSFTDKGE